MQHAGAAAVLFQSGDRLTLFNTIPHANQGGQFGIADDGSIIINHFNSQKGFIKYVDFADPASGHGINLGAVSTIKIDTGMQA